MRLLALAAWLVSGGSAAQPAAEPPPLRGVHLTAWVAGDRAARRRFLERLEGTSINAVVVPVKEYDGKVYLPGVERARRLGTQRVAIPRPEELVEDLRARGLKPIARVVVFKDAALPALRPEWAIHDSSGGLWGNDRGTTWTDPYRREIWDYNLDVAERAAALGFAEIQFDYIRFPSDGETSRCRYSRVDHSSRTAVEALSGFLEEARRRLAPHGVVLSAAVFGLTTTVRDDMGIGQQLIAMEERVDYLSPMMYPSHYAKGEYGMEDPEREPYRVIRLGLRDAKRRLGGDGRKLRPYLQDFSLNVEYGAPEVTAQILAARELGIESWILWNPLNRYNWGALRKGPEPAFIAPEVSERLSSPGRPL